MTEETGFNKVKGYDTPGTTRSQEDLAKEMAESAVKEETKILATTEFLRYYFTKEEKEKLGEVMAQSVIKVRELEERQKAVSSQFASDIKQEKAKTNSTAQRIESGFEMRTIDCEEHYIYGQNIMRTIRLDSGEVVKERTMTNAELQQEMFKEDE